MYIHIKDGSLFTKTLNGGELLDQFGDSLHASVFMGVPSGACLYHLITGHNPYGIGGLAWVNATCTSNFGATSFLVDSQGDDEGNNQYLNLANFILDCATQSIKSALPTFCCMWSLEANNCISPQAIFCNEEQAKGDCLTMAAHYSTNQCYNILPFNDTASSFQLFTSTTSTIGLQLFFNLDCFGNSVKVCQFYAPTMPQGFNNQVTSFKFIME